MWSVNYLNNVMKIIPFYLPNFDNSEFNEIKKVFKTGKLTRGEFVQKFEKEMSNLSQKKYCVTVSNATSALHLLVKYVKDLGDVILTTPFSFIASANAGLYENKKIIFVDIDKKTLLIDEKDLEIKINLYKGQICAVIYVDIFGLMPNTKKVKYLCNSNNIFLIEDASQAILSKNQDVFFCSLGDASVISFHENKQITTGGEGGMILTDDFKIYNYCKSLSDQGRILSENWMNEMYLGYNYRMTEIQAAFGIAQIKRIYKNMIYRQKLVSIYEKKLSNLNIKLPFNADPKNRSWFVYNIKFNSKEDLNNVKNMLDLNFIQYNTNYFPRINKLSPHQSSNYQNEFIDEYYEKSIALPLYEKLSKAQVEFICTVISDALNTNKKSINLYNNLFTEYEDYIVKVKKYLDSVDNITELNLSNGSNWLDVGSANGERIINLNKNLNKKVMFIDNSEKMLGLLLSKGLEAKKIDISNKYSIKEINQKFDNITCLYNVLGHIDSEKLRNEAFKNINKLLDDNGIFIFDVNNRWNYKQYGFVKVIINFILDILKINSGDYDINIQSRNKNIKSKVHLFNYFEIKKLLFKTGFKIKKSYIVDYKSGEIYKLIFKGQIIIVAQKYE